MANKTIKEATLFNDYNINEEEWKKSYLEFCNANEITPNDDDESLYDYIYESLRLEWDDMLFNIDNSKYDNECAVIGTLGLWFGNRDIKPVRECCLTDAIKRCVGNSDYSIVKIVDGHIEVKGIHHDGTNNFEIHLLNKLGQRTEGADLTKECYYQKIKTDFWG